MSTVQIQVHWREPVDGESNNVFRGCTLLRNDEVLQFKQGALSQHVNIAATQLITITPEKETA